MAENDSQAKTDASGKNASIIYCSYCPSKILNPGVATLMTVDFPLPYVLCRSDRDKDEQEPIQDYWLIQDINHFENIGVSRKVENVKYLACADCERGPVGWHDLSTYRSYLALSRVKHEKPTS